MKMNIQGGFTLVELMIVVAIIGILASIAVPNYQKYQAKARTSEAQMELAGIYTAESTFFAEHTQYTACLRTHAAYAPTGYSTTGTPIAGVRTYYTHGFTEGACSALTELPAATAGAGESHYLATTGYGGTLAADSDLSTTICTTTAFTARAAGKISAANVDKWSIDQNKTLKHDQAGF